MGTIFTRTLGKSAIEVSALGMGCWQIGGATYAEMQLGGGKFGWGEVDDDESIRALHAALAAGVTFFETADVYGGGHSEEVLGRALTGRRQQAVIATKFGFVFDPYTRQMLGRDSSSAYIRRACEGSLKRLNTDYIDLYLLHNGDIDELYIDDVCDVLERMVAAGKIRAYGWCTWPNKIAGARTFAQHEHCAAIEHRLNVLEDAPEMLTLCEQSNLASIVLAPLAMSLLTGKFTRETHFPDGDVRHGWNLSSGPEAELLNRAEQIREILTSDGCTPAQGALRWLWSRSSCTIPIPGFRTVQQVEENAEALRHGPLSQQQIDQLNDLSGKAATMGILNR